MPWLPRAITLDLDDTLWPIAPAIDRAEAALEGWLRSHAPRSAARWPLAERQRLRAEVDRDRPHLAHDMSAQRRHMLERLLALSGDDPALMPAAYEAYFAARCDVEHYADTLDALGRLAAHAPLAALSNGNADLGRIGLLHRFAFQLAAGEHGVGKPDPSIFHAACARLGTQPHETLHVGDDPEHDVVGAALAGMRTCWINRRGLPWTHAIRPDVTCNDLGALADWLEARHATLTPRRIGSHA